MGPSHFVHFSGLAVSRAAAFQTPLGAVPVDDAIREEVLRLPHVLAADAPHEREHSLEVQLPFLQVLLGEFRILPVVAGDATARQVAAVLEIMKVAAKRNLHVRLLDLRNSGDTAAERSRVVGYGAFALDEYTDRHERGASMSQPAH